MLSFCRFTSVATALWIFCSVLSASAQFETNQIFPASLPYSIAIGDFNHDGVPDLAIANACCPDGGLAVYLGHGDGTFSTPQFYSVGTSPVSVVAADLNRDGNLDLVSVSQDAFISILLGNGDGTFRVATQSPPVPTFEQFIAVADVNGDGIPDLMAFSDNNPCKCISVLMGNGDGTFQDAVITQPTFAMQAISVGDFDSDGHLDIATVGTFGFSSSVNILLGNGDGTFREGATHNADSGAHSIAVADFSGDGKLDLAIAGSGGLGISVWLGNGDGTFQPPVEYPTTAPDWVTAADVNGDGKLDLIAANSFFPRSGVSVFLGHGDGTFQAGRFYPGGTHISFVAAGDFNGDGMPDLVMTDIGKDHIITMLNTGLVTFSPTTPIVFPTQLIATESAPQTVTLTNRGKTALAISAVAATAGFRAQSHCGHRLATGASCGIDIRFTPAVKGTTNGLVTIADSASTKRQVIDVSGVGTVVQLSPVSLSFRPQKVGTTSLPLPVAVHNIGSVPITFDHINIGGANPLTFIETNTCGSQLAAGASCTINVQFKPKKTGPFNANLDVGDNGGGSPQMVALSGTGT